MTFDIITGDALDVLKTLPENHFHTCISSPPYFGLRSYGVEGQIGLEETPEEYIEKIVRVFREVRRVLRKDGSLWLNIGDSYWGSAKGFGHDWANSPKQRSNKGSLFSREHKPVTMGKHPFYKPKDLMCIPFLVAVELMKDGWYLRQDIVWNKLNTLPESVRDRCSRSHEYIFLLTKSRDYYFDCDAILEDGREGKRRLRSVWSVNIKPIKGHHATFPPKLIEPCVKAGTGKDCCKGCGAIICDCNDVKVPCRVLDPFNGSGTTGVVALAHGADYVGIELNPEYAKLSKDRLQGEIGMFE